MIPPWDCSTSTNTEVICTTDQDLAPGNSLPDIVVVVNVGQTLLRHIDNIATVTSPGDTNPDNDTDDDQINLVQNTRTAPTMSGLGVMLAVAALLTLGLLGLRRAAVGASSRSRERRRFSPGERRRSPARPWLAFRAGSARLAAGSLAFSQSRLFRSQTWLLSAIDSHGAGALS